MKTQTKGKTGQCKANELEIGEEKEERDSEEKDDAEDKTDKDPASSSEQGGIMVCI